MGKRRSRGSAKANGINLKTDGIAIAEQLKLTKAEMEQKMTRILKQMKNKDQGKGEGTPRDSKKEADVVGLVEDVFRNYQAIYEQYDHLREETEKIVKSKKEKEKEDASRPTHSNSSPDSDTEYYSSEEMNEHSSNLHIHQNGESEKQIARRNQALVDSLLRELDHVRKQKRELEDRKNEEISKNMILIGNLKEDLTESTVVEQRMLEEKEWFLVRIKDLEMEADALQHCRSEVEEQNNLLRSENHWLNTRNSELEISLTRKETEASSQTIALMEEVKNLKQEVDSLQAEKNRLGHEKKGYKQEFCRRLSSIEMENNELKGKIDDQERILKEKDETVASLNEKFNKANDCLPGVASSLIAAERKMEESAKELRSSLENKIRLLSQRILVAEQLHSESKENYKSRNRRYEQEKRQLEQKIANHEAALIKLSNMNELGIDRMATKFEQESIKLVNHILTITKELTFAKYWARSRNIEIKQLKIELARFAARMEEKEEQELSLREKLWNLEAKISKEGGEKLNMIRALSQFEKKAAKMESTLKEKDEELFRVAEEKREAIRQLCVVIEHHRSHYDDLKEAIIGKVRNRSTI